MKNKEIDSFIALTYGECDRSGMTAITGWLDRLPKEVVRAAYDRNYNEESHRYIECIQNYEIMKTYVALEEHIYGKNTAYDELKKYLTRGRHRHIH